MKTFKNISLKQFIEQEKTDKNLFWKLNSKNHQNLLNEALEKIKKYEKNSKLPAKQKVFKDGKVFLNDIANSALVHISRRCDEAKMSGDVFTEEEAQNASKIIDDVLDICDEVSSYNQKENTGKELYIIDYKYFK